MSIPLLHERFVTTDTGTTYLERPPSPRPQYLARDSAERIVQRYAKKIEKVFDKYLKDCEQGKRTPRRLAEFSSAIADNHPLQPLADRIAERTVKEMIATSNYNRFAHCYGMELSNCSESIKLLARAYLANFSFRSQTQ